MIRDAPPDKQVGQYIHHIIGFQAVARPQAQAFARILVNHRESADLRAVFQAIRHKVICPYMVRPAWAQTDARTIVQIQTASLLMLLRDFQGFLPPDPLNPLVVDDPSFYTQQRRNPLVSIAAIVPGEFYNIGGEGFFVIGPPGLSSLQSPALPQSHASAPLCNSQFLLYINHSLPPPLRAGQNFPVETSFKIKLSRLRSATTRFRRAFSCSKSLRRLA